MTHTAYEWVYVGVVISLLTYVGAEAWNVENKIEHTPKDAKTIRVIGQQWFWTFEHEDGTKEIGELHVKKGIPYRFEIVAKDVIHDFAVADFAILMDAVPGRINTMWNVFDETGEYLIQCKEYCGLLHYDMKAKLFVEENDAPAGEVRQVAAEQAGALPSETSPNNSNQSAAASGTPLIILAGSATQGNPDYDPDTLTVAKGDAIAVTNEDTAPHTVTSGEPGPEAGQLFDTGIMEGGASATIETTSLEPGEYPYHCMVHPYMTGTLTVQ